MSDDIVVPVEHLIGVLEGLQLGERLIVERVGVGGKLVARVERGDVPVLGTSPVSVFQGMNALSALGMFEPDPLAHLSPEDRESARRLNEALAEPDVNKADLRWRFEVTNRDGTPVSEEERQEFVRKAMEFANRMDKVLFAFNE